MYRQSPSIGRFRKCGRERATLRLENVEYLNSLQVLHAERFLFSCDGDFAVAEKMIAANAALSHGPRFEEVTGKF
jgi:hypothetical protein